MKWLTILVCCFALLGCEDDAKDEENELSGTWNLTNMGEFASADCSGELDYTGWAILVAFGGSMTYTFDDNGTLDVTTTVMGITETESATWELDGDELCVDDDCNTVDLSENTLTLTGTVEAYCEDMDGEEIDGVDMTACEAAGNDWYEATCYELTITRQ